MITALNTTFVYSHTTIIGGSDGPTSIFLAASFDPVELILPIAAVMLVIIGLVVWRIIRNKKRQH